MASKPLWNKPFACCLALQAIYMFSFNMSTPLVAGYVEFLGGTTFIAGVIAGMFSILALVFRPFVGALSDRTNRTRLLTIGSLLGALSFAGYGISTETWMVAAFRVTHAFALCVQTTLVSVIATSFIPKERTVEGVSCIGVAAMLGMSLGPGCGVIITSSFRQNTAFFISSALMIITALFCLALPAICVEHKRELRLNLDTLLDTKALPLTVAAFSFAYCAGLTTSFLVLVGSYRSINHIALFYLISSAAMVITRPAIGRYADKKGIRGICFTAFAMEAICMSLVAVGSSIITIVIASIFRAFGQGAGQTTLQGQVLRDSPLELRGRASSTFYIGVDFGQGMGAIIGGGLADAFGFTASFLNALPVLFLGAMALHSWSQHHRMMSPSSEQTAK